MVRYLGCALNRLIVLLDPHRSLRIRIVPRAGRAFAEDKIRDKSRRTGRVLESEVGLPALPPPLVSPLQLFIYVAERLVSFIGAPPLEGCGVCDAGSFAVPTENSSRLPILSSLVCRWWGSLTQSWRPRTS